MSAGIGAVITLVEATRQSDEKLAIEFSSALWTGTELFMVLGVTNDSSQPVHWTICAPMTARAPCMNRR